MESFVGKFILHEEQNLMDESFQYIIGEVLSVDGDIILLKAFKSPTAPESPDALYRHKFLMSFASMAARPKAYFIFDDFIKLRSFLQASPRDIDEINDAVGEAMEKVDFSRLC
jgi:hypothetical protein